jgi:hypothetical protein
VADVFLASLAISISFKTSALPKRSNRYIKVDCYGGFNQRWRDLCDGVDIACLPNETLVLLNFEVAAHWNDTSGFADDIILSRDYLGINLSQISLLETSFFSIKCWEYMTIQVNERSMVPMNCALTQYAWHLTKGGQGGKYKTMVLMGMMWQVVGNCARNACMVDRWNGGFN